MNDKCVIVIGANFGDEGKGHMVDYFTDKYYIPNRTAVVRYNSGSQAGHTVVTPDKKRHVFSHIGSGAFVGAHTILYTDFITNPMVFAKEFRAFKEDLVNSRNIIEDFKALKEPVIFMDSDCVITLPYDILLNQTVEKFRGIYKHGSCGLGVWETVVRNRTEYRLRYSDILYYYNRDDKTSIKKLIKNIRDNYYLKRIETEYEMETLSIDFVNLFNSEIVLDNFIEDLFFILNKTTVLDTTKIIDYLIDHSAKKYNHIIYEGAQGLLLSSNLHTDSYKHTTVCHTGLYREVPRQGFSLSYSHRLFYNPIQRRDLEVCYVTRPYLTRHGSGPFAVTDLTSLSNKIVDETNTPNEFQGKLRYGILNVSELKRRIVEDMKVLEKTKKTDITLSVAITHLDETDDHVYTENGVVYTNEVIDELEEYFKTELPFVKNIKFYRSTGTRRNDVTEIL